MPPRVLIVDDESAVVNLLDRVLTSAGYQTLSARTGGEGLDLLRRETPDLIILDLDLPDVDGEDVCRQMRRDLSMKQTPILVLIGKDEEGLSARCLNGGADSCLVKPFEIEDVLAHVKALLRRVRRSGTPEQLLSRGRMTIRVGERAVLWKGRRIGTLAPKEFQLLYHLVAQSPQVVDKNALAMTAWGAPFKQLHERTLDVHIRRIRKKLGPSAALYLRTIPSIGFQWLDDPGVAALRDSAATM